jgi:hypothetical protein
MNFGRKKTAQQSAKIRPKIKKGKTPDFRQKVGGQGGGGGDS